LSCSRFKTGSRTDQPSRPRWRLFFGREASSLSATEQMRPAAAASAVWPGAEGDLNALIAEAGKDLADYQRLTAEGKLGEAGQKLEALKRAIDKLNARQR